MSILETCDKSSDNSIKPVTALLIDRNELREALRGVIGIRPSREFIQTMETNGMPVIRLGARVIRYDLNDVLGWIRAQTVARVAPPATRSPGQRVVSDPRLRLVKR